MPEQIIAETDEYQDIEVTTDGWPDKAGSVRSVRREWMAGHEPAPAVAPDDRIAALEAKVAAAEALASKANATAQEVAQAMKNAAPGQTR